VIPPGHEAHVPVEIARHRRSSASDSWLAEPKQLASGVITARVVLNGGAVRSVMRIINYSRKSFVADSDLLVGIATPVIVLSEPDTSVNIKTRSVNARPLSVNHLSAVKDTSHVDCIVDRLPKDLSPEETRSATKFIRSKAHLFSRGEYDVGRTDIIEHSIDTGDSRPIKQSLRRHATAHLPYIDATVDDMLKHDIIEPAASPWASNVVLIKKKDGGLRFCIDYRHLNNVTYKDCFPLARIDSCLESLGGNTFFSTMDLRAGYWQSIIRKCDRDKTAFITRKGQFRFKVLSFGLCCAPSQFARTLELVMSGLTYDICLVYLDDVIVFGKNYEEHQQRLESVLSRLEKANLKLKPSKCCLYQRKVSFLGHIVSKDGVSCDPEKVAAVRDWQTPTCISDVRSFCGLASYYRAFIKGFADLARPLHELTKKGARFEWTVSQQHAFDALKSSLTSAPILASPRDEGLYYLDTDSSNVALGAVLQQEQDGQIRVIAYASRSLSDAESNYCTTRKELLAVIFGLKKFRQHLLGRPICVRTDHAALTYLMKTPEPIGQQARWLDVISEFNMKIVHRPGRVSSNADGLSRRHCARGPRPCCVAMEQPDNDSSRGTTVELSSTSVAARGLLSTTTTAPTTEVVRSTAGRTHDGRRALDAARALAVCLPSSSTSSLPGRDREARPGGCSTNRRWAGAAPLSAAAPEFVPLSPRGDRSRHRPPPLQEHSSTKEAGSSIVRNDVPSDIRRRSWTSSHPATQVRDVSASPSAEPSRASNPPNLINPAAEMSQPSAEHRSSQGDDLAPIVLKENRKTATGAVSDHGLRATEAGLSGGPGFDTCGDVRLPVSERPSSHSVDDDCREDGNDQKSRRPPSTQGVSGVRKNRETGGVDRAVRPTGCLVNTSRQQGRNCGAGAEPGGRPPHRLTASGSYVPDASGPVSTGACCASAADMPSGHVTQKDDSVGEINGINVDREQQRLAEHCTVVELFSADNIRREQENDISLKVVRRLLQEYSARPEWTVVQNESEETKIMWGQWESLVIRDGLLCRHFVAPDHVDDRLQIIMPGSLRRSYVQFVHESCGHWKVAKTANEVARRVYFPAWRRYVQLIVSACDICAAFHKGAPPKQTPLRPFQSSRPMDLLHMDLVGPLPTGRKANGQRGFVYILTVIDNASKFLITVPLRNKETETVVDALVQEVFMRHSFCKRLLSDLGQEFQSALCQSCLQAVGIQQLRTSSMHPACNSVCERVHCGLHSLLAKAVQREQATWPDYLPAVTLAYNVSVHSTTGWSPYFLFHGRQPICELDLITKSPEENLDKTVTMSDYALQLTETMRSAFDLVQQTRKAQVDRMKKHYDTHVKAKTWTVGEMVWYYYARKYQGRFGKWESRYIGPMRVMEVVNATNCILQRTPRAKPFLVHADRLKKYVGLNGGKAWDGYKSTSEGHTASKRAQLKVPALESINNSGSESHTAEAAATSECVASPRPVCDCFIDNNKAHQGAVIPVDSKNNELATSVCISPHSEPIVSRRPTTFHADVSEPSNKRAPPRARSRVSDSKATCQPDAVIGPRRPTPPSPSPPSEQPRGPIGRLLDIAPPTPTSAVRSRRNIRPPARYRD